jgi:hypothetical protein
MGVLMYIKPSISGRLGGVDSSLPRLCPGHPSLTGGESTSVKFTRSLVDLEILVLVVIWVVARSEDLT